MTLVAVDVEHDNVQELPARTVTGSGSSGPIRTGKVPLATYTYSGPGSWTSTPANFGRYNETYGALGAVVVVMLWLYIGAYAAVAGAEVNAELERQTARDTTTGRPEPMGRRDAYAADTLGESPGH